MSPLPFVSIIVPVRNEAHYILRCIVALENQDYPHENIEIIIIDGMSSDGTRQLIKNRCDHNKSIQLFDNPGLIVPTAMNLALRRVKGDILIRVDGHCEIAPDYVTSCVHHLMNSDLSGVGGYMQTIGENRLSEIIAAAMSSPFGVGGSAFRMGGSNTKLADTVPFPAYPRSVVEKFGLYDEELIRNQDDEYNYRIRESGGKILLAADVRSKYYSRESLIKLWKQYLQYGFWKVRVMQKHPHQMRLRQFVPPTFILGLIVSTILAIIFHNGWIVIALVAGSYLIADISASLITSGKKGWKHVLALPLIFATLHFSYGAGFLVGLFKFWNRWADKKGKVPEFILAQSASVE